MSLFILRGINFLYTSDKTQYDTHRNNTRENIIVKKLSKMDRPSVIQQQFHPPPCVRDDLIRNDYNSSIFHTHTRTHACIPLITQLTRSPPFADRRETRAPRRGEIRKVFSQQRGKRDARYGYEIGAGVF